MSTFTDPSIPYHHSKFKITSEKESKNSRSHTDNLIRQLPIQVVLTLASKGFDSANEEDKQQYMELKDNSKYGNQTIELYEKTLSQLQKLIVDKNDQYKRAESENRVWKTEKLALKSTIDDLKYQLQFRNFKSRNNKTDDTLKLKKKLKDYEKKLLKMKQQSLQSDYLEFENQIEKTLIDLNEFSNHWLNPSPKLLCLMKDWKDAKRHLSITYSEAKTLVSNHLKTLEKGKDIPDFDSILSNSIGFQLPKTPNFLQLTEECQLLDSATGFGGTSMMPESNWSESDYQSMSVDSSGSHTAMVTNQVVSILSSLDLGFSKVDLMKYTDDYIKSNPAVTKLDAEDISAELVLHITAGM